MAGIHCSKCGDIKKGSYLNESWCGKCIGESRKAFREKRRAEKGLPPIGSGRDPKCKKCRIEKEVAYKDSSLCGKCKCELEKIRYANKIAAEGKESRRVGRNPICKCGTPKENLNENYCTLCANEKKRLLRLKKKLDPAFMQQERDKAYARYRANDEHRLKRLCREKTRRRIISGKLVKLPCEVCNTTEAVQAHHDDYSKPMDIRWLCTKHHAEHHTDEKNVKLIS